MAGSIRDIERKLPEEHTAKMNLLLDIAKRILMQQRHDLGKMYSMHVPEVECIANSKTHKPYEFGVKVGIVSTSKESFVVGMKSLPGNPYDGHTLSASLAQVERLTGAFGLQMPTDLIEQALAQIVGFQQMVELAHRGFVQRTFPPQIDA